MRLSVRFFMVLLMATGLMSGSCQAFMLGGTRVVLSQDKNVVSLPVISAGDDPVYLIRARVTSTLADEQSVKAFMLTPPLFRLDQGARNEIRIAVADPQQLARNRESLFYLKVSGIPSTNPLNRKGSMGYTSGRMLIGTGNIIKLFYRPHGIGRPDSSVWQQMQFSRVPGGVQITNPTPWYINFSSLNIDGHPVSFGGAQMQVLPPFGKQVYLVRGELKKRATWQVLDDDGKTVSGEAGIH